MSKAVDRIVDDMAEKMLSSVVSAKYESLEGDIAKVIGQLDAAWVMKKVKRYFPPEIEYAQQLADLKARE